MRTPLPVNKESKLFCLTRLSAQCESGHMSDLRPMYCCLWVCISMTRGVHEPGQGLRLLHVF